MILDFIWNKKKPKIKKDVIIQDIEHGGIKVPSFAGMVEANRIMWIQRIMNPYDGKWKSILTDIMKPFSVSHIVECNLTKEFVYSLPIIFYRQIFDLWNATKSEPESVVEYMNQIIWNNKFISIPTNPKKMTQKTSLSWSKYYKAGIVKVRDIYSSEGKFLNALQIQQKFHIKINFLHLKTLQSAIPKVWQTEIYETLSRALTNDVVSLQNTNFIVRSEQKDVSIIMHQQKMYIS